MNYHLDIGERKSRSVLVGKIIDLLHADSYLVLRRTLSCKQFFFCKIQIIGTFQLGDHQFAGLIPSYSQ